MQTEACRIMGMQNYGHAESHMTVQLVHYERQPISLKARSQLQGACKEKLRPTACCQ